MKFYLSVYLVPFYCSCYFVSAIAAVYGFMDSNFTSRASGTLIKNCTWLLFCGSCFSQSSSSSTKTHLHVAIFAFCICLMSIELAQNIWTKFCCHVSMAVGDLEDVAANLNPTDVIFGSMVGDCNADGCLLVPEDKLIEINQRLTIVLSISTAPVCTCV